LFADLAEAEVRGQVAQNAQLGILRVALRVYGLIARVRVYDDDAAIEALRREVLPLLRDRYELADADVAPSDAALAWPSLWLGEIITARGFKDARPHLLPTDRLGEFAYWWAAPDLLTHAWQQFGDHAGRHVRGVRARLPDRRRPPAFLLVHMLGPRPPSPVARATEGGEAVSVQKRVRNGKTAWVVRWHEAGREGRHFAKAFDRQKDAAAFEREVKRRAQGGAFTPTMPSSELLKDFLSEWWGRRAATWAASTRRQRGGVIDVWIVPYIGSTRLRDLGSRRVDEWRSEIVAAGAPPTQANHALAVVSAALGVAARDGRIPQNPCVGTRKLGVRVERRRALSALEVERIRQAMPTPRDRVLVSLMALAGLRPGEAIGLGWDSVLEGRLLVDRSFTDGGWRPTKSNRPRVVELVEPLAEELEALRPRVLAAGELVAPNRWGAPLDVDNWRQRRWRPACAVAGVDATIYDLRHTYVSLRLHEGRSAVYVADQVGHASAQLTWSQYAHMIPDPRHAPMKSMVEAVAEARRELGVRPVCADGSVRVLSTGRSRGPRNRRFAALL
jgi:integrase